MYAYGSKLRYWLGILPPVFMKSSICCTVNSDDGNFTW